MAFVNNWLTFDGRLIEFVRLKPILYNTRLKDFRNKNMKENAWRKTFAISRRPSVCLSSVFNVRAPNSAY